MGRSLYIASDLHLGLAGRQPGNSEPSQDPFAEAQFSDFLEDVAGRQCPAELILLGDAFDFQQTARPPGPVWPEPSRWATQGEAVRRMRKIVESHPVFFRALAKFIGSGNKVRFVPGNHDGDLIAPGVQRVLREALVTKQTRGELVFCSGDVYRDGPLYCEHGSRYSVDRRSAATRPWLTKVEQAAEWARLDRYESAAVSILKEKQDVHLVVFGHTHSPVDGNQHGDRLKLPRDKLYFNSGSWARGREHGVDPNRGTFLDGRPPRGRCTARLDFVRVTFEDDGSVSGELGSAGAARR